MKFSWTEWFSSETPCQKFILKENCWSALLCMQVAENSRVTIAKISAGRTAKSCSILLTIPYFSDMNVAVNFHLSHSTILLCLSTDRWGRPKPFANPVSPSYCPSPALFIRFVCTLLEKLIKRTRDSFQHSFCRKRNKSATIFTKLSKV